MAILHVPSGEGRPQLEDGWDDLNDDTVELIVSYLPLVDRFAVTRQNNQQVTRAVEAACKTALAEFNKKHGVDDDFMDRVEGTLERRKIQTTASSGSNVDDVETRVESRMSPAPHRCLLWVSLRTPLYRVVIQAGPEIEIQATALSPDGSCIAILDYRHIRVFDLSTKKLMYNFQHGQTFRPLTAEKALFFCKDLLVFSLKWGLGDHLIFAWSLSTGELHTQLNLGKGAVGGVTHHGHFILVLGFDDSLPRSDELPRLHHIDVRAGNTVKATEIQQSRDRISYKIFVCNDRWLVVYELASPGRGKGVSVFDLTNGSLKSHIQINISSMAQASDCSSLFAVQLGEGECFVVLTVTSDGDISLQRQQWLVEASSGEEGEEITASAV